MLLQPLVSLLREGISWATSVRSSLMRKCGVLGDWSRALIGLFFLLGLSAGSVCAQVSLLTVAASVVEQSGTQASKSLAYTVGAGSNRLLVVTTNGYAGSAEVASVTFGGVPLTRGVAGTFGNARSSIWYLTLGSGAAPITSPVVVTYSANFFFDLSAMVFQGVDQVIPVSGAVISYVPGLTVTSAPGDLAISTILGLSLGLTAGADQTIRVVNQMDVGTGPVFSGTSTATGAATVAMTWAVFLTAPLHTGLNLRQAASITVTPDTLPGATINVAGYSVQIAATGGTGAKTLAVTSGVLPSGLALTPGGLMSGTPTAGGTFDFTVTATDATGATGSRAFSIVIAASPNVAAPTVAELSNTAATLGGNVTGGALITGRGIVYARTAVNVAPQLGGAGVTAVTASGTTGTFTVNVAGLVPSTAYSFVAYATNALGTGYSPVGTFTTPATAPVLSITTASLPNWVFELAGYSQAITATGGTGPKAFSVTVGALPPGLTLSPAGIVSGRPTAAGTYNFTITATDTVGVTASRAFTVTISATATPLTIVTATLPNAVLNVPGYSQMVTITGGVGATIFSASLGALPPGLALSAAGNLGGTPTAAGTYAFTIIATDALGATASRSFVIIVSPVPLEIATTLLPAAVANLSGYNQMIATTGGTAPIMFSIGGGALPVGLALSTTGTISGRPTTIGNNAFTVVATDALGISASRALAIAVSAVAGPLAIEAVVLPGAVVGLPGYSQAITATGGVAPIEFSHVGGTLPNGLALSPTGTLSGTPSAIGTYTFTVTATDAMGTRASRGLTVVIVSAVPLAMTTTSLPGAVVNSRYSQTLAATGGTGAKTFTVTGGALPMGLTLGSAGSLGGVPTVVGTCTFVIKATDTAGLSVSQSYTIVISPAGQTPQNIAFAPLGNRLPGDAPFALAASASSGLPIAFAVSGPAILNAATGTLALTGAAGLVTVTASQAGNATFAAAADVVRTFTVAAPLITPGLIDLAARVRVAPGAARTLIAGFVIAGSGPKRVLLRGIGPALTGFGVSGALTNPSLQLFDATGAVILANDDWSGADTAAAFAQVNAFGLTPGSKDAAVVTTLAPGAYTLQISAGNETGIALAEVYDASPTFATDPQRLVNLATRGTVEPGDGVLIGGFVIRGDTPRRVLIRGIGPGLAAFGVAGPLADPRVAVYSGAAVVAQNDDWSVPTPINAQQTAATAAELAAVAQTAGAFALGVGSKDAALLVTLAPGAYTAQIAGAGATSGVALVEIYEVP